MWNRTVICLLKHSHISSTDRKTLPGLARLLFLQIASLCLFHKWSKLSFYPSLVASKHCSGWAGCSRLLLLWVSSETAHFLSQCISAYFKASVALQCQCSSLLHLLVTHNVLVKSISLLVSHVVCGAWQSVNINWRLSLLHHIALGPFLVLPLLLPLRHQANVICARCPQLCLLLLQGWYHCVHARLSTAASL